MKKQLQLLCFVFGFSAAINVHAKDYFVAPNGNDNSNGSSSSPFRTISQATSRTKLNPGDRVIVRKGTYKEGVYINKSGSASANIVVKSEVRGGAKINPPAKKIGIQIAADYITVDGFEVYGSTTGGIVGSRGGKGIASGVHHVTVSNNISHDNLGTGIFFGASDFITIDGNEVYKTASAGVTSGISVLHPQNVTKSPSTSGFRIQIRNNIVHHNMTVTGKAHTDGNGIILDDYDCHHSCNNGEVPYKFKTLVENNVAYGNGGKGIQVAFSSNATIRNNTAWHNSNDPKATGTWQAEISNMEGDNNLFVNNIAIADPSSDKNNRALMNVSYNKVPNTNVRWFNNITYNGTAGEASIQKNNGNAVPTAADGNKLGVDPRMIYAPNDFSVHHASPAVDSGTAKYGLATADIAGNKRVIRTVDMGAYEQ